MAFLLKKINANTVLTKYLNGKYTSITLERSKKIQDYNIKSDMIIYGDEYTYKLKLGSNIKCNWCSHTTTIKKQNMGIPIEGSFSVEEQKFYYKTEGIFCSYECAYALLIVLSCRNPGLYINSENILKYMFDQDFPDQKLQPANDFWLQSAYGGPLREKDYQKTKYKQSNNRIISGLKAEYELL